MRIVKSDQPPAVRIVQRERIAQAVGPLRRRCDLPDLEFQPIALFEMMNTPVERQEIFEGVLVGDH
jgi:hypothetical protein